ADERPAASVATLACANLSFPIVAARRISLPLLTSSWAVCAAGAARDPGPSDLAARQRVRSRGERPRGERPLLRRHRFMPLVAVKVRATAREPHAGSWIARCRCAARGP